MRKVCVVGGGAGGMMAAIWAARSGHDVTLFEHNDKLGKKLFITGKGRCNVTNACDTEVLFQNVMKNPKFLYSAFYGFDADACMQFFEQLGVKLKTERGNRVFPLSDHSSDIISALTYEMRRLGVRVIMGAHVTEILISDGVVSGIAYKEKNEKKNASFERVILATGGVSYELTGSDGSGLKLAAGAGHTVTKLFPSLVPLYIKEDWCKSLMGLSLRNVEVTIMDGKKTLFKEFGEMLFTHYGVSGPLILSASSKITQQCSEKQYELFIDLKPALTKEQLDKRLLREFEENKNKAFKNSVASLFPSKLIPVMVALSGIGPDTKVNEITKQQRQAFVELIKRVPLTIEKTSDFREAIITRGGVSVKEVNPSTMESKIISGLFFAGEMLDLDALTGGFNLQIAWSTGYLAGVSV